MPRRYHRAREFRREHAYVLLFLPACTLVTCVSLVLADVYRVPELARACTMHSSVTREGFRLRVNLQKTRVYGCAHAIRAILNACTVLASIKFKSSCTVSLVAAPINLVTNIYVLYQQRNHRQFRHSAPLNFKAVFVSMLVCYLKVNCNGKKIFARMKLIGHREPWC